MSSSIKEVLLQSMNEYIEKYENINNIISEIKFQQDMIINPLDLFELKIMFDEAIKEREKIVEELVKIEKRLYSIKEEIQKNELLNSHDMVEIQKTVRNQVFVRACLQTITTTRSQQ